MMTDSHARRAALLSRLRGCFLGDPKSGTLPGGRTEALLRLRAYDPAAYGRTRNFLDAPVSQLSPYLRHGMISAVEVRDHLLAAFPDDPARREEFLRQLAWRDFFEKVLAWHGPAGLGDALEDPKHSVARSGRIPLDVASGRTGLPCVDGMLHQLFADGYLHNHARMWFAAYLCHFRGVRWQEGARLFRQYLYDGDVASNSCSWQWVEGTFAAKPYFMNKENVATFSGSKWCATCPAKCPFDTDYPCLQHRLFGGSKAPLATREERAEPPVPAPQPADADEVGPLPPASDLVWVHDAAMSWNDPALKANPNAAVAFVLDAPALRTEPWAYHRLAFVLDGLDDLFANLRNPTKLTLIGDPAERLATAANRMGATTVHVSEHPNPWVVETAARLRSDFRVVVHPRPVFAAYPHEPKRFSRYWDAVAPQVLG
ncbi:MAG: FAD-binding domain-containing protein, partial [Gemmata sp.]